MGKARGKRAALHLPSRPFRNLRHASNGAGHFIGGEAGEELGAQGVFVERRIGSQDHDGDQIFAQARMRHTECHRLRHALALEQRFIDFSR